ncbi:MAG TPA: carboxypeptidase-like regulatory domain-containing protein [Puia sp.]|nr:carboxypeptidase-like regulatory domain-containing protein [Puia sp.]
MRNLRLTLTLIVLACITTFFACNKYAETSTSSNDLPEDKIVTASLQGRVLDENGSPVQDAAVTSGTASTTTDENGVFKFTNISMSSRFGYVKVVKQGYFMGSRSILASSSSSNYVAITLIPRTSKGTFSAGSGGSVVIGTNDTVRFDASSVVKAPDNSAYTGTVHIFAYYLDPLAADAAVHMPGDLRGIDSAGKETMLKSFGMMVVELEGDAGEKLQIAPGKLASLSLKIPDALKATAPASIPLWYFNDTTGKWIEQGIAVRKGDQYCGETSHFTWWNCDAPTGTVHLKLRLVDKRGRPLTFTLVELISPTMGPRDKYTDDQGVVSGEIPKGELLQMKVISSCGSMIGGANVGPTLTDQDLGTLTIDSDLRTALLTGTLVDCNGKPVDTGFVNITVDEHFYGGQVLHGTFAVNITRCGATSTTAALIAGDYKTMQQTASTPVTVDTGTVDVGQLTACSNTYEQYIRITVGGKDYLMNFPTDSIDMTMPDTARFESNPVYGSLGYRVIWVMPGFTAAGTYSVSYFGLYTDIGVFGGGNNTVQCTITQFADVNGFIEGTLNGNVYFNSQDPLLPMTGIFKVRRTQ